MPNFKEEFEKCAAENKKLKDKVRGIQGTLGIERMRIDALNDENTALKKELTEEKAANLFLNFLAAIFLISTFILALAVIK